eukprot:5714351-Pleurochrysis_carterae.AAC.2
MAVETETPVPTAVQSDAPIVPMEAETPAPAGVHPDAPAMAAKVKLPIPAVQPERRSSCAGRRDGHARLP